MPTHPTFRPAIDSPATVAVARLMLPLALRVHCAVQRVEIAEEDVERLRGLRDRRVVLTPNHPTNSDPGLVFELSRRAGMPFHYLCCREAFDGYGGWWGRLIQRVGAYSVVRGTTDRRSFRYTRDLLARPASKLVIFPEGEVYSQNDSLLPFQVGSVQLAVWGREEARKTEPDAQVWLLPCAVKYRFVGDVRPELARRLQRMEQVLKLELGSDDLYVRMRRLAVVVLRGVEREYGLQPAASAEDDLTPRFEAAKEAALQRAAELLGMPVPRGTLPERMRALLHAAEQELNEQPDEPQPAPDTAHAERVRQAWNDLQRLSNWVAVYDGYVRRGPDQEHLAEVVLRLAKDICGAATYPGLRIGTVRVGAPIALPETVGRRDLPALTLQLEQAVAALLHAV